MKNALYILVGFALAIGVNVAYATVNTIATGLYWDDTRQVLGIGTTTPLANFQVTTLSANATTSVEFGKSGQNKGDCITHFRTDGSALYEFIAAGATTPTYTTTKPSGCQS